jgi:hypothetical protein
LQDGSVVVDEDDRDLQVVQRSRGHAFHLRQSKPIEM